MITASIWGFKNRWFTVPEKMDKLDEDLINSIRFGTKNVDFDGGNARTK